MIQIQWHFLLYLMIMVILAYKAVISLFFDEATLDLSGFVYVFISLIITVIYGGIFWW